MQYRIFFLLAVALLTFRCATQTTPTGGPKDETPPKLISTSPKNGELNFKGRTIELEFDELIKLQNPKDEVIIIPPVGKKTEFTVKRNKVQITPENPWQENTTYSISFRESVQDMNEGNPVENLKLAFSTGPYIDSLKIEGNARDALTDKIIEDVTVAIFTEDTFNIFQHSPSYFTKIDKEGKFNIGNLKANTYRLYAFKDKNKNLKVDSRNEVYAFKSDSIPLTKNSKQNTLRLIALDSRPLSLAGIRTQADVNTIRFNKPVRTVQLKSSHRLRSLYNADHTELITYYPNVAQDSLQIGLSATDSLDQKIDTLVYIKKNERERIKDPFRVSTKDVTLNEVTNTLKTEFTTNKLIQTILYDSLFLELDSARRIPLPTEHLRYDTLTGKITLEVKLSQKIESKKNALTTGRGFLISIDGDSNRRDNKNARVLKQDETGSVFVEVKTKHPHFIVQLLTPSNEIIDTRLNEVKPIFKYLPPQNIKVRLIIDRNNNGIWDTANYLTNTEAEEVYYYKTEEGSTETPVRANWELGPLVVSSEQNVNKKK